MKMLELITQYAQSLSDHLQHEYAQQVALIAKKLESIVTTDVSKRYMSPYASLNVLDDEISIDTMYSRLQEIDDHKISLLLVIGIGGSNLGARAVHEALKYSRSLHKKYPEVWWLDTIDPLSIREYIIRLEHALRSEKEIHVIIISKSGSTTETIVHAQLVLDLLKKYNYAYKKYVTVISDHDSPLTQCAQSLGIYTLPVPSLVGGRFSVLSYVGLFPLALLGYDITQLCAGALSMRNNCLVYGLIDNPAALSAVYMYNALQQNITIHNTFVISPILEYLGLWYRQLLAESTGKKTKIDGSPLNRALTPIVSVATNDLHAVVQLYLDGPTDKITTFVTIDNWDDDQEIPQISGFDRLVPSIKNHTTSEILAAIIKGVMQSYADDKRPFMHIRLPDLHEYAIGEFLQLKMMEIFYFGELVGVNIFDQPAVERYKAHTRKMLHDE